MEFEVDLGSVGVLDLVFELVFAQVVKYLFFVSSRANLITRSWKKNDVLDFMILSKFVFRFSND